MYIDYNRRDLDSLKTYHINPNETRVTHSEKMRRKAVFYNVDRVEQIVNKHRRSSKIGSHTFYFDKSDSRIYQTRGLT